MILFFIAILSYYNKQLPFISFKLSPFYRFNQHIDLNSVATSIITSLTYILIIVFYSENRDTKTVHDYLNCTDDEQLYYATITFVRKASNSRPVV